MHTCHGLRFFPDDAGAGSGDDGAGDGDGAGEEELEELTPEEIKEMRAENDRLKSAMAKSRTEKARETKAAKDAAAKAAKDEGDASLLQKQLDEERAERAALETRLQRTAATSIAATLGAIDADAVVMLLDWDTLVDPGDPNEVKQAVRQLLKEKPFLRKATKDVDAGEGGTGNTGKTSFNDIIRGAAGR